MFNIGLYNRKNKHDTTPGVREKSQFEVTHSCPFPLTQSFLSLQMCAVHKVAA